MELSQVNVLLAEPPDRREPPPVRRTAAFERRLQAVREEARKEARAAEQERREPARRPSPLPRQAGSAAASREGRTLTLAERSLVADQSDSPAAWHGPACGGSAGGNGGHGGDGGDGRDEGSDSAGVATDPAHTAFADELDCEMLADLLPTDDEGGIFELLLPNGERLGVVADFAPGKASFLLSASSERLRVQLDKRRMELEKTLAQRMDRNVSVAVI